MAPKILTWDDMLSHEELMAIRRQYTDEQARNLGYPSAEVLCLEDDLSSLAGEWRETKKDALIKQYHLVLYEMILKGYDVDMLPVQDQLLSPRPDARSAAISGLPGHSGCL